MAVLSFSTWRGNFFSALFGQVKVLSLLDWFAEVDYVAFDATFVVVEEELFALDDLFV